jgi:MFS family permease
VFTDHAERTKAILWSAVSGLGVAIGPVAGGWLLAHFSWESLVFTPRRMSNLVVLVERQAVLVRNRRPQRGEGLLVLRSLVIRHR